jgi:phenylpyruvate tautomerase PptA (4-oxalocrotonate tautomerase family)
MPYLSIQTNKTIDASLGRELMQKASQSVAEMLGKPEKYVMVALPPAIPMLFAGSYAPLAYLELKSIGLPQSATAQLSQGLCTLVGEMLDIPQDRIYIEFADADRPMWGWNGKTF